MIIDSGSRNNISSDFSGSRIIRDAVNQSAILTFHFSIYTKVSCLSRNNSALIIHLDRWIICCLSRIIQQLESCRDCIFENNTLRIRIGICCRTGIQNDGPFNILFIFLIVSVFQNLNTVIVIGLLRFCCIFFIQNHLILHVGSIDNLCRKINAEIDMNPFVKHRKHEFCLGFIDFVINTRGKNRAIVCCNNRVDYIEIRRFKTAVVINALFF